MPERLDLRIGEERPVGLPALGPDATWSFDVSGMRSAVDVRKLWTSDPYRDEDDEDAPFAPREMVFMVRGAAPGEATVRFTADGEDARDVEVRVSM